MIANIDGSNISAALSALDPQTSLFVVASKTVTSRETMVNAHVARQWFLQTLGAPCEVDIGQHFVAGFYCQGKSSSIWHPRKQYV